MSKRRWASLAGAFGCCMGALAAIDLGDSFWLNALGLVLAMRAGSFMHIAVTPDGQSPALRSPASAQPDKTNG